LGNGVDKKLSSLIKRKIWLYNWFADGISEKEVVRNELYEIIKPFMMKWLFSLYSQKGIFASNEEVLSKSWDCFEFCLKHFKRNKSVSVPNHFYNYTKYYMMSYFKGKKEYESTEQDLEGLKTDSDCGKIYDDIDELKTFRKCLPKEYALVFDDALMSLYPVTTERISRRDKTTLSVRRYAESKKVFKWVIDFLIRK